MKRNADEMMNSTIFSNSSNLTLDTWKSGMNNNVIVVGSSGSGKTRKFIKPNILQKNTSYIITDVKGNLVNECGEILSNKQDENDREYAIKVLNLIDLTKSMHYNPFVYIDNEEDIFSLVEFVVANNNNGYRVTNDSFWQEASTMLLTALIGFVYYNLSDDERNFNSVMKLLDNARATEEMNEKDDLDLLFEMQEKKFGNCFEVRFYNRYKTIKGKTKACVLATLNSILSPWELTSVKEMVRYDELELDKIGDRHMALFVMVSDTDNSKNFLAGILYSQLFKILCRKADNNGGRLNIPTRFLLDDFACIGVIPQFENIIASIRSRQISACVILQNESQLDSRYGDMASNIIGNCDTYIFMGSNELEACRRIAERLDRKVSTVLQMPTDKCYVFSRQKVFYDTKYNLEQHKRYREKSSFNYHKLLTDSLPLYKERTRGSNNFLSFQNAMRILENNKEQQKAEKKLAEIDTFEDLDELTKDIENMIQEVTESTEEQNYLQSRELGNELRSSFFDSLEEEKFYHDLIDMFDKYNFVNLQVDVHVHLNEIFSNPMSMLERNKYKYRLVNQHCDFVVRDRRSLKVIAGIEIDGSQHVIDVEQIENDAYKDETFKRNGIPLLRIRASEARANYGWRNKVYDVIRTAREVFC